MAETRRIEDIRIEGRHRKDMGDIEGLARSMNELGLLHPVAVTPDNLLIAGERRILAARMLGWDVIPVHVVDLAELLSAERDENMVRKDFTPTEAVAIGRALEPIEREAAAKRQEESRANRGVKFTPRSDGGESLAKVAAAVGMSRPTYAKAAAVVDAAEREPDVYGDLPDKMDTTGKVDSIYKEAQARQRAADIARKTPALHGQFGITIRRGDFRNVLADVASQSVKIILTDPPYGKKYLDLWDDLGKFAARVLRPDGLLVTYSGQLYLPEVIASLTKHLDWWWLCGLAHQGNGNLTPLGQPVRKVINQFKPLLIMVPRHGDGIPVVFRDLIMGHGPEKDLHNWQQPVGEAAAILSTFCAAGDIVVDPFAGSGSIGQAAQELGMPFIGAEILGDGDSEDADG